MTEAVKADEIGDIEVGRYGLRTFKIDHKRRELRALTQRNGSPTEWDGGICIARCRYSKHKAPNDLCSAGCGVYAANSLEGLKQFGFFPRELTAVIAAEGKTIIGETGFRTEAARVVAYWAPYQRARKVCEQRCAGAKHYTMLDDMLRDYGLPRGDVKWGRRRFTMTLGRLQAFWVVWCASFCVYDSVSAWAYFMNHNVAMTITDAASALLMGALTFFNYHARKR
jgi:hypothetical protein